MRKKIEITPLFQEALDKARLGENLFITGKAGTGKSTLLKLIEAQFLDKILATVAPTGVAALNIGGRTIHSFFEFQQRTNSDLSNYKIADELYDLEILIVDEISMVRADLLDMMHTALTEAKKNNNPFGGIQVIFVGDLYQLPPILVDSEESIYREDYATKFFFSSRVYNKLSIDTIELDKIFRQKNKEFIEILNKIRNGEIDNNFIEELNSKCYKDLDTSKDDEYIYICSTNDFADRRNNKKLQELKSEEVSLKGWVEGAFNPNLYKAEENILIKMGARVMTIVNHRDGDYVNGSIGYVKNIKEEDGKVLGLEVELIDKKKTVFISRHKWEIYKSVKDAGVVKKESIGSFNQFPIKLAWAITVHKSQGKTFNKVVFERGRGVFEEGQLYVALSRCTSLEGIVFQRKIKEKDVKTNKNLAVFFNKQKLYKRIDTTFKKTYFSLISTGGQEHSKPVELGLIIEAPNQTIFFETLINPQRDLTDAREYGLTDTLVSIAPRADDVAKLVSALCDNSVFIGQNSEDLFQQLGFYKSTRSQGVPIDITGKKLNEGTEKTAFSCVTNQKRSLSEELYNFKYFEETHFYEVDNLDGIYFLPRDDKFDVEKFLNTISMLNLSKDLWEAIVVGSFVSFSQLDKKILSRILKTYGIERRKVTEKAIMVVKKLRENALINKSISEIEKKVVDEYSKLFNLGVSIETTKSDVSVELRSGMRVCFTGNPASTSDEKHLAKSILRKLASEKGIFEAKSVGKTNCDLLVAYDIASMSRKNKQAKELDCPIISSEQFVRLIESI